MKSEEMLKAINNIDDELIVSAEEKSDSKPINTKKKTFLSSAKKVNSWASGIAAVLAICILGGVFGHLAGFRMGGMKSESAAPEAMSNGQYYDKGMGFSQDSSYIKELSSNAANNSAISLASAKSNVKLFYIANLTVQTTEYEKTLDGIKQMVNSFDGYFQGAEEYNGDYYYQGLKSGCYTIRIPAENYRAFLDSVGEGARVVRLNETVEDIGQQYYDVESKLETLNIKLDRLQELLKKADNMSDIITLENEISDVEYQIQSNTTTLNKYDSLIGYSTITLNLQEVNKYDGASVQREGFGTRFIRAIKNGLLNAADGIESFAIWVGYNLVRIIIFAVVVLIIWKSRIIARIAKKINEMQ